MKQFALIGLLFLVGCGGGGDSAGGENPNVMSDNTAQTPPTSPIQVKSIDSRFVSGGGDRIATVLGEIINVSSDSHCIRHLEVAAKNSIGDVIHTQNRLPFKFVGSLMEYSIFQGQGLRSLSNWCLRSGESAWFQYDTDLKELPSSYELDFRTRGEADVSEASVKESDIGLSGRISLFSQPFLSTEFGCCTHSFSGQIKNNHPSETIKGIRAWIVFFKDGNLLEISNRLVFSDQTSSCSNCLAPGETATFSDGTRMTLAG